MFSNEFLLRLKYLLGVCQVVFTPFITAYSINLAKIFHLIKFLVLMPSRFYQYKKKKWHYYMTEFCYYVGLLTNLFLIQNIFFGAKWDDYFISIYCLTNGPLLSAIILNNDKLFIHSLSHLTSIYIHLTPALLMWGMRWHHNTPNYLDKFPIDFTYNGVKSTYLTFVNQSLFTYLPWIIGYVLFVFIWAHERIEKKENLTLYNQMLKNDKNKTISSLKKTFPKSWMRKILYVIIHVFITYLTTILSSMMFHSFVLNTFMICFFFTCTVWFGSKSTIKRLMIYEKDHKLGQTNIEIGKKCEFYMDEYENVKKQLQQLQNNNNNNDENENEEDYNKIDLEMEMELNKKINQLEKEKNQLIEIIDKHNNKFKNKMTELVENNVLSNKFISFV